MRTANLFLFIAVLFTTSGCGRKAAVSAPVYDEMKHISDAPPALQKAAKAIVKIRLHGSEGTGSFVSPDGLLLTNNHVLGIDKGGSCALEGCYIHLYLDYQLGTTFSPPIEVFAEPRDVNQEWDASLFQIWTTSAKTARYIPQHSLQIAPVSTADLMGRNVHVVGHPLGSLKKWSAGEVFEQQGAWFTTSAPALPGNSGSPFLSDEGKIVGLLHRGGAGPFTRNKVLTRSIGTPGLLVSRMVAEPKRANLFFSVMKPHTAEEIAENHESYLMHHKQTATLADGTETTILKVLGDKCDAALKIADFRSPNEMKEKISVCLEAVNWIKKKTGVEGIGQFIPAISSDERTEWRGRLTQASSKLTLGNAAAGPGLALLPSHVEENPESKTRMQGTLLENYIATWSPKLSFELATFLVMGSNGLVSYQGTDVAQFITGYRSQSKYEFQYDWVIQGHFALAARRQIGFSALVSAIREFFADEKLNLESKLSLEQMSYEAGLL